MNTQEQEQILNLIKNLEEKKAAIPFLADLEAHPIFGPIIQSLSVAQKKEVEQLINTYITEKIEGMTKTKGGQLFKRFFDGQTELFWKFRSLQLDTTNPEFQILGKKIEHEMFTLEGILTERMLDQEKGLDKVISSFYNIVYLFFPKFGEIE